MADGQLSENARLVGETAPSSKHEPVGNGHALAELAVCGSRWWASRSSAESGEWLGWRTDCLSRGLFAQATKHRDVCCETSWIVAATPDARRTVVGIHSLGDVARRFSFVRWWESWVPALVFEPDHVCGEPSECRWQGTGRWGHAVRPHPIGVQPPEDLRGKRTLHGYATRGGFARWRVSNQPHGDPASQPWTFASAAAA